MTELTNNEIRVKIAKLRGANWYEIDGKAYICNPPHAAMLPNGVKMVDEPLTGSTLYYRVDNWPCDMREAWKLAIEAGLSVIKTENGYFAGRYNIDREYFDEEDGVIDGRFEDGHAEADTAPRAICLAYIAWKESQ